MTEQELRLECLKLAAEDERQDSPISVVVARAARYAAFVLGQGNADAASTPILAAEKSLSPSNAWPAIKSDMAKPIPASAAAPTS